MDSSVDILMITYNRAEYTKLSLARLLDTCDESMRVWVWHNGDHEETLEVVKSMQDHPRFYKFYHSQQNKKLREPTNWFWANSEGGYLTKVDDDCLMPYGWADTLRKAHVDNPEFGVIGCWRFPDEDFAPEHASKKINEFDGNHRIMRNCWVEGSGYLMKRECYNKMGSIKDGQSFPNYCVRLAQQGYINGWYYPFLYQEHYDDPRSEHSLLKCDADMREWAPLSAINNGVVTVQAWGDQLKRSAALLQRVSYDVKYYTGWRKKLKGIKSRVKRMAGIKKQW
jgi:glycosyltransferase involved in cell wall biosynthesis